MSHISPLLPRAPELPLWLFGFGCSSSRAEPFAFFLLTWPASGPRRGGGRLESFEQRMGSLRFCLDLRIEAVQLLDKLVKSR